MRKALSSHSRQPYNPTIGSPFACTSSPRPILLPSLLPNYIYNYQQNKPIYFTVFLTSSQLYTTAKCKPSPNYSTQATCNEPPRCHLPSLPPYRTRNSVSPSPSFTFFASTSRSPCRPVAPAPRRIMLTAPLPRAGADTLAVRLQPLEQRAQQARDPGEVDGCCWMREVWRCWAVTSRG